MYSINTVHTQFEYLSLNNDDKRLKEKMRRNYKSAYSTIKQQRQQFGKVLEMN